tara:strand:- start:226 stop:555 length:330 start_codon:yes stop_codon:yes gene_type:complete
MRAGSDIGYCDSDYPRAPFEWCEQDIKANVEALGFNLEDVNLGTYKMDLYLTDKDTYVGYDFFNFEYTIYETFTRKDFLREYDEIYSPCCGADIIEDYGRCKHCKEAVI